MKLWGTLFIVAGLCGMVRLMSQDPNPVWDLLQIAISAVLVALGIRLIIGQEVR